MKAEPNKIVEDQLNKYLLDLEQTLNADVLAYSGVIADGVDDMFRDALEAFTPAKKRKTLAVILETPGGGIEATQRIAETLRHHYPKRVEFIVPNYAMSAGTILVMSGDAIHMDYYSVLGPIDPQVLRNMPDGPRWVPALGYLHKYDELVGKSNKGTLSGVEAAYFVKRFDMAELYEFTQARELSVTLLVDWLTKYKFKDWTKTATRKKSVTSAMRKRRAQAIARTLNKTEKWHTHGRGISMQALRGDDIKLKIDDFGTNVTLNRQVRLYHRALTHYIGVMGFAWCLHTREAFERPVR